MPNQPRFHAVYKCINKLVAIWGVERLPFLLALIIGGATFNLFGSLLSGLVLFGVLYLLARWAMAVDRQFPRILLNSSRFGIHYDPAKRGPIALQIARRHP